MTHIYLLTALILPAPQDGTLRSRPIRIAKDTTYLTEPLDQDGHVDYVEALNRLHNQTTPVANANVAMRRVLGAADGDQPLPREEYFQRLGITVDQTRVSLVLFEDFARTSARDLASLNRERRAITGTPWDDSTYPFSTDWLAVNAAALQQLRDAAKRPDWFEPLFSPTNRLIDVATPQDSRTAARLLVASAMFKIGSNDKKEVWEEIVTCKRLGTHIGQGATLIEGLVGYAIENMARKAEYTFLSEVRLPNTIAQRYRKELRNVPLPKDMASRLAEVERFAFLDTVCALHRGEDIAENIARAYSVKIDSINAIKTANVDYNDVLIAGNAWFDRVAAIASEPIGPDRFRKIQNITKELVEFEPPNAANEYKGPDGAKQLATAILRLMYAPRTLLAITNAETRQLARTRLSDIAWELRAFSRKNKKYPQELSELKSNDFKVPLDPFSGKPFVYSLDADGGCMIYSWDTNRKDDGGIEPGEGVDQDYDYVVRLKK